MYVIRFDIFSKDFFFFSDGSFLKHIEVSVYK